MASFKEDTRAVNDEFSAISNQTQVFIWTLVALGLILGVLIGGAIGYGVAVEEVDGLDCIEFEDGLYCADGGPTGDGD